MKSKKSPELDPAVREELEVFRRGAVDLIEERDLVRRLERAGGRGLRVKFGMDPTSPDLHLGHAVPLMKLRALQDRGHQVVLIVGVSTAMVGDPSGRNKLRPPLSREEVEANLATYTSQASRVLDMDRVELHRNSDWFDAMAFGDVMRLAARSTVARMLERDTFETRMKKSEPVGVHELMYPLMQAWDSVSIRADVEIGGTDQLFNLLFGRTLQEQEGQEPQVCLTLPLINGLDGRKMSKSYGNSVGLTDEPSEIYGKVMAIEDEVMGAWFRLLTSVPEDDLRELLAGHPREAKARLAHEIVAFLRDAEAASEAARGFDRQFRDRKLPEDIPEEGFPGTWPEAGVPLAVLLREMKMTSSASEARRLSQQGAIRLDGVVASDPELLVPRPSAPLLIQVGKRRFLRVRSS